MALLAVFAVLAGNLQRARSRSPQKSWTFARARAEITANRPLFFRCFPLFFEAARVTDTVLLRERVPKSYINNIIKSIICQYNKQSLHISAGPSVPRAYDEPVCPPALSGQSGPRPGLPS
jgi:hypothetical protein